MPRIRNTTGPDLILHRYLYAHDGEEANTYLEQLRKGPVADVMMSVIRRKTRYWRYLFASGRAPLPPEVGTVETQLRALTEQLILDSLRQLRQDATPPTEQFNVYARHICAQTIFLYQRQHLAGLSIVYDQLHKLAEQDARFELLSGTDMRWALRLREWQRSKSVRPYSRTLSPLFAHPPEELVQRSSARTNLGGMTEAILRTLDRPAVIEDLAPLILWLRGAAIAPSPRSQASRRGTGSSYVPEPKEIWTVNRPLTRETVLKEFAGYVDYVEDGSAYASLVDQDGREADAIFDAEQLAANGIAERDNFAYTISTVVENGSVIARFQRTEPTLPSPEEWQSMRARVTADLGDYLAAHE